MEEKIRYMAEQFECYGFTFSELQKRKFYSFYEMLVEKNKVMNLTGITEFEDVVDKHFLDSVYVNRVVDFHKHRKVIDLGTGAGFPGIPLKIAFPELQVTLVDSSKKKIDFLGDVVRELELENVELIHARAEDLAGESGYRESFDLCVSRAVANLCILEEYCIPFVRVGGTFISYKSGDVDNEVKESKKACLLLGGRLNEVYKFEIHDNRRSFVVIEKKKETPRRFPRKAGVPSKNPLK